MEKITPQQLSTQCNSVESIKYLIEEPITIILNAIEDLDETRELSGRPYLVQQVVDLGYIIISTNRIFRSNIRKWMRRPKIEKTWVNYKHNFTDDYQELRNADATVEKLGFHSANTIVIQFVQKLCKETP